ncbi:hypothetical protein QBC37DRAFT_376135 [Rhypophila decipiens]|uniref:Uncharacterized protein n=1 Tax=Rhypophila decipiens TaxID=261697 RepID=A0AAN7B576_9PEZI|nr:hypothetical protein QBC37DRAFT_376135 [Rhypophila decipiens]
MSLADTIQRLQAIWPLTNTVHETYSLLLYLAAFAAAFIINTWSQGQTSVGFTLAFCHLESNNVLFPQVRTSTDDGSLHPRIHFLLPYKIFHILTRRGNRRRGVLGRIIDISTTLIAGYITGTPLPLLSKKFTRYTNATCRTIIRFFNSFHGIRREIYLVLLCTVVAKTVNVFASTELNAELLGFSPAVTVALTTLPTIWLTFSIPYLEQCAGQPVIQLYNRAGAQLVIFITEKTRSNRTLQTLWDKILTNSQGLFKSLILAFLVEFLTLTQRYVSGVLWNFLDRTFLLGVDRTYLQIWTSHVEAAYGPSVSAILYCVLISARVYYTFYLGMVLNKRADQAKTLASSDKIIKARSDMKAMDDQRLGVRVIRRSFFLVEENIFSVFASPSSAPKWYNKIGKPFLSNIWVETSMKLLGK